MNTTPDAIDAKLLDILQAEFPLTHRPFAAMADQLSLSPDDVLLRVVRLKSDGIIRQISAIFDSAALGYQSTLVAFKVNDCLVNMDSVAQAVSQHPGVSHCYSRDAEFNLWFTLTIGLDDDPAVEVSKLAQADGVESYLVLPAIKVFKIGVFLRMADDESAQVSSVSGKYGHAPVNLSIKDRAAVKALQKDIPLVESPFAVLAGEAGMTEDELLARAHAFLNNGVMRRFAAVLRHQRAGYKYNAMVCWNISPGMAEDTGQKFAEDSSVSHCYERPTSHEWPYSLYTMVHARAKDELAHAIGRLAASADGVDYMILRSIKEYKKSRVVYFSD